MRESFARKASITPEEKPVEDLPEAANDNGITPIHLLHPETANDNESSQPISTIYSESTPTKNIVQETVTKSFTGASEILPEAANDAEEINEKEIEAVRESLRQHAEEAELYDTSDAIEVPLVQHEEELGHAEVAESAPGHADNEGPEQQPKTAQAGAGAEDKDDGNGNGPKKPILHAVGAGGGEEKQKGWLAKAIGGFFKVIWWFGALTVWATTTAVRKITESVFKGAGYKDGAGGGGGGAKKAASSGGHGGGHGGGGGHH